MSLTFEQRQRIRTEIHKVQKKRFLSDLKGKLCAGCGCPRDTFTSGCRPCGDRRRKRGRDVHVKRPTVRCSECGAKTRSRYGLCTTCQQKTGFVASRQAA